MYIHILNRVELDSDVRGGLLRCQLSVGSASAAAETNGTKRLQRSTISSMLPSHVAPPAQQATINHLACDFRTKSGVFVRNSVSNE